MIDPKEISRRKDTPNEVAKMWGCSIQKVLHFIHSGSLIAIDLSTKQGGSPRFKIDIADLEAFELSRRVVPPAPEPKRRRRSASIRQYV